jgi:putative peptidoglycan lipid II flippase
MAGASVRAYAPGLVGFVLVKVLAPGYFARQDTRTPVRIGIQALLLSMTLSLVLVLTLSRTGWAPAHAGIAAATACSGLFNAAFLLRGLLRSRVYRPTRGWRALWLQALGANAAMALVLIAALVRTGDWLLMSRAQRLGTLAIVIAAAAAVYFGACWLLGMRPRALRLRAA